MGEILEGGKGDIMIPHTLMKNGDNYFFENELTAEIFEGAMTLPFCRSNGYCFGNFTEQRFIKVFP
jgi:hypothetical protein